MIAVPTWEYHKLPQGSPAIYELFPSRYILIRTIVKTTGDLLSQHLK